MYIERIKELLDEGEGAGNRMCHAFLGDKKYTFWFGDDAVAMDTDWYKPKTGWRDFDFIQPQDYLDDPSVWEAVRKCNECEHKQCVDWGEARHRDCRWLYARMLKSEEIDKFMATLADDHIYNIATSVEPDYLYEDQRLSTLHYLLYDVIEEKLKDEDVEFEYDEDEDYEDPYYNDILH